MREYDLYNTKIDQYKKEQGLTFDELVFSSYFDEIINVNDIANVKTDNYGDAGIDYMFFSLNKNVIYDVSDLDDMEFNHSGREKSVLDCYIIQVKDTNRLSSQVPKNFIEFIDNLKLSTRPNHYNQQMLDAMDLYDSLIEKLVLEVNINFHFYYISKVGRKQLANATDLYGCFETLKANLSELDYVDSIKYYVITIQDIIESITKERSFKYKFRSIDKFEAETEEIETGYETKSVISLIPIKQYYQFICESDGQINDKLFESNIRDYKGRSNVNKKILDTLKNNTAMDFWWLNNGITITAEQINESQSAKTIEIVNPQIVNGLQTSYSIFQYFQNNPELLDDEERKIFVKVLKIDNEDDELDVIVATNSQNEIRDKDIHANDDVQKNIEMYFKTFGKYYQRKDKYYTNRHRRKKDIIRLDDLAKYVNTIYLKDPGGTRNNPGKLVQGTKYETIFKINDQDQDYERYKIASDIYSSVNELCKGELKLDEDIFDKSTFIHHVVYCLICMKLGSVDYTPTQVKQVLDKKIGEKDIEKALNIIVETLNKNKIPKTQIIKQIKNQSFTQKLNQYMSVEFRKKK